MHFNYIYRSDETEENNQERKGKEALLAPSRMELKVITQLRHKRRHSHQSTRIIVKSIEDESIKVLPGVLLTFNEKFIRIGVEGQEVKQDNRVIVFKERSDSLESTDI